MDDRPAGPPMVSLVGLHNGCCFGPAAERALASATVVIGARRHLDSLGPATGGRRMELGPDLAGVIRQAGDMSGGGEQVCIVASGDPGFFGLSRLAATILGSAVLAVHPAPSAVSLAFARLGLSWEDATVVSAHGRPLQPAVEAVARCAKVAVLTSPDNPPEALGRALVDRGCGPRTIRVLSRLDEDGEADWQGDVAALAAGRFDPLSVVIAIAPSTGEAGRPSLAWGLADDTYLHRGGMITKSEVRAVVLGRLALPPAGVMWDVGAGSGSVSAESARLAPGLEIFAVERRPDDLDRLRANVTGTQVEVVAGTAPAALAGLPDPDRVFVGGGGPDVLDACLARVRPGAVVVATYAAIERAAWAAGRLGNLVQIAVSRGVPIGSDPDSRPDPHSRTDPDSRTDPHSRPGAGSNPRPSLRLAAENPVFVCWGRL